MIVTQCQASGIRIAAIRIAIHIEVYINHGCHQVMEISVWSRYYPLTTQGHDVLGSVPKIAKT